MSFSRISPPQRLVLAAGLLASAVGAAVVAWRHAARLGGEVFLCGSAQAHCWACYAAPLLALLAVAVLAAPQAQTARASQP